MTEDRPDRIAVAAGTVDDRHRAKAATLMARAISLPGDDRRSRFTLPAPGRIDFAFFDALSDWPVDDLYDADRACIHKGRPLSRQELGCYASHVALWRMFLASDHDRLLVLEDDVVLDWGAIDYLIGRPALAVPGGILRLFSRFPASHRIIGSTECRFITRITGYASGTQAYLIDRSAAQALLRYCRTPTRPIDDQIDREWDHGVATYALFPYPAYESIGPSRIAGSMARPVLSKMQAVRRFCYRCADAAVLARSRLIERVRDRFRTRRASN